MGFKSWNFPLENNLIFEVFLVVDIVRSFRIMLITMQ